MKPAISIIVPVYQAETYLEACIASIRAQTFSDYELILVDDGSPDRSGMICDHYAGIDDRIKVIHQDNAGVSAARNAGLAMAEGAYIGFVDSDDSVRPHMYEYLYNEAVQTSADIVVCDFHMWNEEGELLNQADQVHSYSATETYTNIESLEQMYIKEDDADFGTGLNPKWILVWNKLYKRDLFTHIQFAKGIVYQGYQDEKIAHQLLYDSKKTVHIRRKLYDYVTREKSLCNLEFSVYKFERVYALKQRADFFKEKKLIELHERALINYMDRFFWTYYLAESNLPHAKKELKQLKRTMNDSLGMYLGLSVISWKQKIFIILFVIHPHVLTLATKSRKRSSERGEP